MDSSNLSNLHWTRVGFGWRFLAALIDSAIMFALAIGFAVGLSFFLEETMGTPITASDRIAEIVMMLVLLTYTSFEIWTAATPGKLLLKLRIGDQQGGIAGGWTLFLRWSTKNSPQIIYLVAAVFVVPVMDLLGRFLSLIIAIGCLFTLRESKLAWHDEWARTAVYTPEKVLSSRGFAPMVQEQATPAQEQPVE